MCNERFIELYSHMDIWERRKTVCFFRFAEAIDRPEVLWSSFRNKLIPVFDFGCFDSFKIGSFGGFNFEWSG